MRRPLVFVILVIVAAVVLTGVTAGPLMSQVERPPYKIERAEGAIELRAYPVMTVATTSVSGNRGSAIQSGFRTLAGYIFGANDGSKKIEMTAPVMQGSSSADAIRPAGEKSAWNVQFVMPRAWSRESLPKPRDPRVRLETVPAATFAVIRFSGFARDAQLRQKTGELQAFIARNKLAASGAPIYAFYNPPWTLPFFRRNEVMIEVRP